MSGGAMSHYTTPFCSLKTEFIPEGVRKTLGAAVRAATDGAEIEGHCETLVFAGAVNGGGQFSHIGEIEAELHSLLPAVAEEGHGIEPLSRILREDIEHLCFHV
jgi:hypothetical protein